MNKFICATLFACFLLSLLPACHKPDMTSPAVPCNCKLLSIYGDKTDYGFTFKYDAQDRLEYRFAAYQTRQSPDYKFIYDANGRLSQFITNGDDFSVGSHFFEWHYLYYDSLGRATKDTLFIDGEIGPDGPIFEPGTPPSYNRSTIEYTYDAQNRITSRTTLFNSTTYAYNAQGNLVTNVYGDSLQYDNKINFNRTDPVLQFINRDYSVNNPLGASVYNRYGLPLVYPGQPHGEAVIIIDYAGFYDPIFTYTCR